MRFHDYIQFRCIALNTVAEAVGLGRSKLRNAHCPNNLTAEEVARLKHRIGDWDKLDEEGNEKEV